jgi:hypothetical protein
MALHARQLAIAAGASGDQVPGVAARLVAEGTVRLDRAQEIMAEVEMKILADQVAEDWTSDKSGVELVDEQRR